MKCFARILSLLLVVVMLVGCFSACDKKLDKDTTDGTENKEESSKESKDSKENQTTEGSKETEKIQESEDSQETEDADNAESEENESEDSTDEKPSAGKKQSRIATRDLKNYKFVISADASETVKLAAKLACEMAAKKWSSDAELKTDDYAEGTQEKYEILIGATNRPESIEHKSTMQTGEGGYAISGTKITVSGHSDTEMLSALTLFYQDYIMTPSESSLFFTDNNNLKEKLSEYVSIMSFNIYYGIDSDSVKKANAINLIRSYSPDIFGVQEASERWQLTLKDEFSKDYHIIGVGRDANGDGEAMKIFVKKSKFNVKSSGTKWLSDTPDKVSKLDQSACHRIVTYAVLERISDGKVFNYANTHIDHEGAQEEQIRCLAQIIEDNMQKDAPTFVTGDFNLTSDQPVFSVMTELGYTPSYELAEKSPDVKAATFGTSAIIDYIFVNNAQNVETKFYKVCNEKDYGEHSDHKPILSIFRFK